MITVWGRKSSSNVQATLWCLAELGLVFDRIDAGLFYGVVDSDEYVGMNPNRTVPTLVDGDMPPMFETGAILRYLASRYGDHRFWPVDLVARAQMDKWAEWAKINVEIRFAEPIFWLLARTSPQKRSAELVRESLHKLTFYLEIADARLAQHPYLAGDDFTLADIVMGHSLFRYYDIPLDRADLPHLRAYYDRLTQRPAFAAHVMVDYEELRVTD